MANIKKHFQDLRQSTPKYVQWLLLGVAFVVVIILLTLLLGGDDDKDAKVEAVEAVPVNLLLSPEIDKIDWADTVVGQKRSQTFILSATAPVKILGWRQTTDVAKFGARSTCENIGQIDANISCELILEYDPTTPTAAETFAFAIDWRGADAPDEMKQTHQVTITVGAEKPFVEPEPIIIREPAPVPTPVVAAEVEEEPEVEPVKKAIEREIEEIAPSAPIEPKKAAPTPAANCSSFAFPGYDSQGTQIGWIKPERGAYYFHPFSDKNCDSATGVYNPDTGFITDIDNPGKKIGTDAEHIGYIAIGGGLQVPQLSNAPAERKAGRAYQLTDDELGLADIDTMGGGGFARVELVPSDIDEQMFRGSAQGGERVVSSMPYDRTFILRQYKPIPATIVSEILADPEALAQGLPVRATVDRNVYSDNGRTVILPAGTLMLGYVTGDIPGPYKAIGRMNIKWYQFIRPDGVEFNFANGQDPFSADSQGRSGVPGRGSTDYMEQFIMPMLTAIVPAAVNLIAPISDKFVNQIDLDNNTVVQSGTVRSSELAKNEIITAWNQVAQKLLVDMMDNAVPPFSIAAGTRITVYSPVDLIVTCGTDAAASGKKCAIEPYGPNPRRSWQEVRQNANVQYADDGSLVGQVRSFSMSEWCTKDAQGLWRVDDSKVEIFTAQGYAYGSVKLVCESQNYKAINNAKQEAVYQNQQTQFQQNAGPVGSQQYNENVLGLEYTEEGAIVNPFQEVEAEEEEAANVIKCEDGTLPDANGCCTGEIFTDMGEQGFNCCPEAGGDCFPPIL